MRGGDDDDTMVVVVVTSTTMGNDRVLFVDVHACLPPRLCRCRRGRRCSLSFSLC